MLCYCKLEEKMATAAIAAVGSVPITGESSDRENILIEDAQNRRHFHAKIRLCINDYF
jgi:hypothetical protein